MFIDTVFDMDLEWDPIEWDIFVNERREAVTDQDIILTMISNFFRQFNGGDTYEPLIPGKFK